MSKLCSEKHLKKDLLTQNIFSKTNAMQIDLKETQTVPQPRISLIGTPSINNNENQMDKNRQLTSKVE